LPGRIRAFGCPKDKEETFPFDVVKKMGELGLLG